MSSQQKFRWSALLPSDRATLLLCGAVIGAALGATYGASFGRDIKGDVIGALAGNFLGSAVTVIGAFLVTQSQQRAQIRPDAIEVLGFAEGVRSWAQIGDRIVMLPEMNEETRRYFERTFRDFSGAASSHAAKACRSIPNTIEPMRRLAAACTLTAQRFAGPKGALGGLLVRPGQPNEAELISGELETIERILREIEAHCEPYR